MDLIWLITTPDGDVNCNAGVPFLRKTSAVNSSTLVSISKVLSFDNGTCSATSGAAFSKAFKNAFTNSSGELTITLLPSVSNASLSSNTLSALLDNPML